MSTIRPAGLNEQRCIARDSLGLYGSIVVVAKYHKSTERWDRNDMLNIIQEALKNCISEHAVLSTIILDSDAEQSRLAHLSAMDIRDYIRTVESSQEDRILEIAHNERFEDSESKAPWRTYITLPEGQFGDGPTYFQLAFSYSHALADGRSGLVLHGTFSRALEELNGLDLNAHPEIAIPDGSRQLLPPLEQLAVFSISYIYLFQQLATAMLPPWICRSLGLIAPNESVIWTGALSRPERLPHSKLLPTAIESRQLMPSTIMGALKVSRTHNARLTGVLVLTTARALAAALHQRGTEARAFKAEIAIDLRRAMEFKHSIGNFVSAITETVQVSSINPHGPLDDQDWEAAARITKNLQKKSSSLQDQPVALLRYLSSVRSWVVEKAANPSKVSFGMSNLGAFPDLFPQPVSLENPIASQKWSVADLIFSQSADATGAAFNVNVISGQTSSNLVLTWWPGMLGVEDERQFMDDVCGSIERQLKSISSESI